MSFAAFPAREIVVQVVIWLAAVLCMYSLRDVEPFTAGKDNPLLTLGLVGLQIVLVSLLAVLLSRLALARLTQTGEQRGRLGFLYRQLSLAVLCALSSLAVGAGWAFCTDS